MTVPTAEATADPTAIKVFYDPLTSVMEGVAVHGNTPFRVPYITPLTDNLWQGGCATGMLLPPVVRHLVSLYPWERYVMAAPLASELYVEAYDSDDAALLDGDLVDELAGWVNRRRANGITLVACQAGLNRSSLVTARALMLGDGMSADEAITLIREKRSPACLCNSAFEDWVRSR